MINEKMHRPKSTDKREPYALKTRKEAVAKGREMLKALKDSKGWKAHVHENLGWHVTLRKGSMSLSRYDGVYSTLFNSEGYLVGGSSHLLSDYRSSDPNKVIRKQLEVARAHVIRCLEAIEAVEN